jgi:hypothetical protein
VVVELKTKHHPEKERYQDISETTLGSRMAIFDHYRFYVLEFAF